MTKTRNELLSLVAELEITIDEAGEKDWAAYLNDQQLADAIVGLRPKSADAVAKILGQVVS